ncbi:MAG: EAL domain-containing protein [Bacilli bacterium]|nr:EAL domain-containing protein [Bacilli bacterium]
MESNKREKEIQSRRTLLIADDDEISGDILASFFEKDYDILRAYTGRETLQVISSHLETIDLVLLDIYMPDLDGFHVLKERQENPEIKKIPVIVMTGEVDIERECFKLGVNDFIKKPFKDPEIIVARVERMIELYEDRSIIKEVKIDHLTNLYSFEFFKKFCLQFDAAYPNIKKDMISINVTRFRLINELYGKEFADDVLRNVAEYLKGYVNEHKGFASHHGTGDFLLYCPHIENDDLFVKGLLAHLEKLINPSSVHLHIGIYPNVDPSLDKDIAIGRAVNLSERIQGDSEIYCIFDEEIEKKSVFEEELINGFKDALKSHQFKVFYQPKYKIQGPKNILSSAEALVRWEHPKYGMISPGVFIPLFETNGFIQALDFYVFEEVAKQQAKWKEELGFYLPVSVNVSRVDVHNPNLEAEIIKATDTYGIPHDKYYLEITESAYSQNKQEILDLVTSLREKGFLVEVDDFGSGYSSLNVITELPFDVLKIDMVFMKKIDQHPMNKDVVMMILALCRRFGVVSVVEGVETEANYRFLKESGCDVVQGYYFSKPLPENEFTELLKKEKENER